MNVGILTKERGYSYMSLLPEIVLFISNPGSCQNAASFIGLSRVVGHGLSQIFFSNWDGRGVCVALINQSLAFTKDLWNMVLYCLGHVFLAHTQHHICMCTVHTNSVKVYGRSFSVSVPLHECI